MNNLDRNIFNDFLKENLNFYHKTHLVNKKTIIVSVTNDLIFNTILLKFGKIISEIENTNVCFIPFLKYNRDIHKLAHSFNFYKTLLTIFCFFKIFIKYFLFIFFNLIKINNGTTLEKYQINQIPIGKHIYDYILIRNKIATINKLSFIYKVDILICLIYFLLLRDIIRENEINSIITLDNVYIEGIVFELSKFYKIKMYTGFNINNLTLHLFKNENDFNFHCRTPDKKYISKIINNEKFKRDTIKFLNKRFSGNQNQHDAKRAFSSNKIKLSRNELVKQYNLNENKIILVLPHVFCDAPHAYPSVFYKDYENWLIDTLTILNNNKQINLIIKEHPSAALYNEEGYLEKLLNRLQLKNVKLISNEINSKSLMTTVDALITCGGTSGMEYAYHGVPVVIASSPPYSHFDFVNKALNIDHYHNLLNNITQLPVVTKAQQSLAGSLLYLFFEFYGINKSKAFLNCYSINRGEKNDLNYFFSYIIKNKNLNNSHFYIKGKINQMIQSNFNNLYKN